MSKLYMVLDLSGGSEAAEDPLNYLDSVPEDGWAEEHKGDKLVLRLVEPGTFTMGSPNAELGHRRNESRHEVTLTRPYYLGVFEVTQRQWRYVMGTNPSHFRGDSRPVEGVTCPMIRGESGGARWPADDAVDDGSFLATLRRRMGLLCDLPTEAQWEYACRAGTTTALNKGEDLTKRAGCPHMDEVGRYAHNGTPEVGGYRQHTAVGSYRPNGWGLYDMHGNVWEWVLDWACGDRGTSEPATDPPGTTEGTRRMARGGCWSYGANGCRSAFRTDSRPDGVHKTVGFRVVILDHP